MNVRTAIFATLFVAATALGHHFKGLPHFNYFENYPQVPQKEFLGQAGDYEFSLVIYDFQGIKKEDAEQPDGVRLFLVIYNLREGKVYNGPLLMRVMDRDKEIARRELPASEEESLYRMEGELPLDGRYHLALNLLDEELYAEIPFTLSDQRVHWGKWIAISLFALLAIVAVGARRARIAQDRRDNARERRRHNADQGVESHA